MMAFPIDELLDENKCYEFLLNVLHSEGLCCPNGHALPIDQSPHKRDRAPVMKYKCRQCGKVFDLFTKNWARKPSTLGEG